MATVGGERGVERGGDTVLAGDGVGRGKDGFETVQDVTGRERQSVPER